MPAARAPVSSRCAAMHKEGSFMTGLLEAEHMERD